MLIQVVATAIGVFCVEDSKVISYKPFSKDTELIAEKLRLSETSWIEEENLLKSEFAPKGYSVQKAEKESQSYKFIYDNLRKLAVEYNFVKDQAEFNQHLTKVNIELTKVQIKKAVERGSLIPNTINAIDELDKATNIFIERLREFYSMHFPEMNKATESNEKFAAMVEKFGNRANIDDPNLKRLAEKSMGADFKEDDIRILQAFAHEISELYRLRDAMSKHSEKLLKEEAPNFTEIATPILAAKLISKAGSLQKISMMASSTVQLLGAEKALFRFLHSRGRGRSPRFGMIYNHPLIQSAPEKLKGKVARLLASKLSIAAKMDFYSKKYQADKMKKELEAKVKEILKSG